MTIFDLFGEMLDIVSPVLYSIAITYFLSYILNFIERYILRFPAKRSWAKNLKRIISIILTFAFVLLLIAAAVSIFIPQIVDSYQRLTSLFSGEEDLFDTFSNKLDAQIDKLISGNTTLEIGYSEFRNFLGLDAEESLLSRLSDYLWHYLNTFFTKATVENLLNKAWGAGSAAVSFIIDAVLTIILSIYLLFTKEKQIARIKKLVNAFCSPKLADKIYHAAYLTDERVGQYLTVQILDSILVGVVSYFVYMIADLPFYPVLALISGVTNIIPYFGPFIGAIPNGIFILISEPSKLLPFIIIVLIIQQIDGNILVPLIQSDNMKLDVFWVLVAMTVMGGIFGLPGMILGVPLFSVLFILIKEQAEELLAKKNLPLETSYYNESRRPKDKRNRLPAPARRILELVDKIKDLRRAKKLEKSRKNLPASGRLLTLEEAAPTETANAENARQNRSGNRRRGGNGHSGTGANRPKTPQKEQSAKEPTAKAPASQKPDGVKSAKNEQSKGEQPKSAPDKKTAEKAAEPSEQSRNRRRRRHRGGNKKPSTDGE